MLSVYRDLGVVPREGRDDNFNKPGENLDAYRVVRQGDLVLNKMKTWQGSLGISNYEGIVSPAYFVAEPLTPDDPAFLHHMVRSQRLIGEYEARSKGIRPSQWDLPWEEFQGITVDLPPVEVQRAIAGYLDRETARLDALIAAKRRMVELVITRFTERARLLLTGGADERSWRPGPYWLGPVPRSWAPTKIAWDKRTGSGTTPKSDRVDYYTSAEGAPWVTTSELREVGIFDSTKHVTSEALRDYSALTLFLPGTVLVAMYGATVGRIGILRVAAATNQACCAIWGDGELDQDFMFWWLRAFRSELVQMAYGSGQPNISQETIRSLRIPAPNVARQQAVAGEVAREAELLSGLTGSLNTQIKLLQERRRALITAAVTGELDIPEAA